ncbi:MAG: VCBS repeat-containing protein [Armatimonadota bacterium]|nr:MAG: VCBS repeat-containing protein [Armatimonadota bacterium]
MISQRTATVVWTLALLVAAVGTAEAAEPQVVWKADIGARVYTSPLTCDLLPSPGLETVVCASETRRVVCLSAAGVTMWSFGEGFSRRLTSTPSAADLDDDGKLEIVVAGGGGNLVCLGSNGALRWRLQLEGGVDWSAPVIADLDGDGTLGVVVGTGGGVLYRLAADGSVVWQTKLDGGVSSLLSVADVNGDGRKEIIVPVARSVVCLDAAGETVWEFAGHAECNGVSVADVDADGRPEILAAYDDQVLCCLDASGARKWAYHGGYAGGGSASFMPPSVADLDGDGEVEIVFADSNGTVRCVDGAGSERCYFTAGSSAGDQPVIGDVDGDGEAEVIVGFEDGSLVCLDDAPAVEWRYMTEFRSPYPGLADLDGDGRVEVIATSNDNYVYCLRPPAGKASGRLPWPMRRLDPQQSAALESR